MEYNVSFNILHKPKLNYRKIYLPRKVFSFKLGHDCSFCAHFQKAQWLINKCVFNLNSKFARELKIESDLMKYETSFNKIIKSHAAEKKIVSAL